jgi:glutamyl-tRNA synthetase
MSVRTRFAPSPTGFLHVGGARTALYSWLFARQMKGQFILRIEDTDLERSTPEAVDAILQAMQWLELDWDEGPFYQTQHFERYRAVADQLLKSGHAYKCYCTKEHLEELRETQLANKEKPRYDGRCRDLSIVQDTPFVVRFRNPDTGAVVIEDCVRGEVVFQNSELDDLIMVRSDRTPTYNFTVVVDDWDMKITHVIRGDDHLNNTPRQINLLKALQANIPIYAHIPMILGSDGKRLSKRHGAVSVQHYQTEGILPQALLNYLVRLGWSHGDQEIFSREEMIQYFNLDNVNKAPAAFNPEKLLWLNQHYIKTLPEATIAQSLALQCQTLNLDLTQGPSLEKVVVAQRDRAKTLLEMAQKSSFFYEELKEIEPALKSQYFNAENLNALRVLHDRLSAISLWEADNLHNAINETAVSLNIKLGKLAQPLRVVVIGGTVSPSIDITLELLGKARVLERLWRVVQGEVLTSKPEDL